MSFGEFGSTLFGINVVSSPLITEVPKLQLSHDFNACSPEMKASFNAWLRERFGTYMPAYIIGASVFGRETVVLSPKHMAMLKATL